MVFFYVSLGFNGRFVIPNLAEFRDTAPLIAAKMSFSLFFPVSFAHARYSSRMIDRFLNRGDHGKPKSGKIKGRCQPPLGKGKQQRLFYNSQLLTYRNFHDP